MRSAYGAKENGICHHPAVPSRGGLGPPPQAARPAQLPQAARPALSSPRATIVVDVANVMGSRPDGWWRDRPGAAVRLHAELAALAARGRPVLPDDTEPEEFVMVLEGATRAAAARISGDVRVVQADGSGDDAIVALVRELSGRRVVVTADRELRRRCEAAGAEVFGPSWLMGLLRER
jgi:8-oxo-dGTP diphosphatase